MPLEHIIPWIWIYAYLLLGHFTITISTFWYFFSISNNSHLQVYQVLEFVCSFVNQILQYEHGEVANNSKYAAARIWEMGFGH